MFAIMKGSSEHIVGECWDILVSWGWKFLLAVMGVGVEVPIGGMGVGVFGRGRLADFFGRDRPTGFFTVAFGMMRWLRGGGGRLGKEGKF